MYTLNEDDPFTGEKKLRLSAQRVGYDSKDERALFSLYRSGGVYGLKIMIPNSSVGCLIENHGKVQIKLESGEILEFLHIGPTNCFDGITAQIVLAEWDYYDYLSKSMGELERESKRTFEKLSNFKILAVRITGDDYYTDIEMTELGAGYFLMYSHCIEE